MRILHTSDWHLGRTLYGKKRYNEFEAFLDWLVQAIETEKIDVLLIAGDVFDTGTPSNRAQELYYRFLCRVSVSCCHHVVVISGNHDSPSFINAPKELLKALNVYVIGSMAESLENELIIIQDKEQVEAIICAVPYLRDKDVRSFEPGETIDDKNRKLVDGIKKHYTNIVKIAEKKRNKIIKNSRMNNQRSEIPIIAMGHLFTAGGKTVDGDGVRELYVGSLAHVETDIFPKSIDYFALGHLHVPQVIDNKANMRYSGSPIPMGFGEANQQKSVVIIEFNTDCLNTNDTETQVRQKAEINLIHIPCFQKLIHIDGDLKTILDKLEELKNTESSAWLEIEYTANDYIGNLREVIDKAISDSKIEVVRIKNKRVMNRVMKTISKSETLDDLDHEEVFIRCLDAHELSGSDREILSNTYREIIKDLHEEDVNAE